MWPYEIMSWLNERNDHLSQKNQLRSRLIMPTLISTRHESPGQCHSYLDVNDQVSDGWIDYWGGPFAKRKLLSVECWGKLYMERMHIRSNEEAIWLWWENAVSPNDKNVRLVCPWWWILRNQLNRVYKGNMFKFATFKPLSRFGGTTSRPVLTIH
jgi:hypothetical protein